MRRSLTLKLIAAFLGVSLFAIALVTVVSAAVTANEFDRFVSQDAQANFCAFVTDYYRTNGSLENLDKAVFVRVTRDQTSDGATPQLVPFAMTDTQGVVINHDDAHKLGDSVALTTLGTVTPVVVDGKALGFVLPRTQRAPNTRMQTEYLQRTVTTLALASVGMALGALVVGVWLARTITRPVRELTRAAHRMSQGELGQFVRVPSRDEVGELAQAFNHMSAELARVDHNRRQMTADIAHELRNPLTVISGYLDAMQSGDLPPTPKRLKAVHEEIQQLEQIVQDLRTLSLADANALTLNSSNVAPGDLIGRAAARFALAAGQKSITLYVEPNEGIPTVYGDEARLTQVLDNLVSNALRHTPQGGTIRLAALERGDVVRFVVADSGRGIAAEDLPHIFERFYRADPARTDEQHSSGLGLPIAKAIVEAHGGRIWAESEVGHGAVFFVEVPRGE